MSLKVLLLEDDESLTREIESALVERACEVMSFADAEQGLGAASAQHFDVIMVSTELRDASGYGVTDRIRSDPATAGVPLVVVSKPVAIPDLIAALPDRRSATFSKPPADLRETVKHQERAVASLRADLSARSQVIDKLTKSCKDLTQRLTEVQALLEAERDAHALVAAELAAMKEERLTQQHAFETRLATEVADRERAHAEETEFLERAHEEANEAATRKLRDSERLLEVERETHAQSSEAHGLEVAELRQLAATLARERDAALQERDDARSQVEANAMDIAQARMDLAEESRNRAAEGHANAQRITELESTLAARSHADANRAADEERVAVRTTALEAQLADAMNKVAEMTRALDAAEREAAQQQLARDAAFHDMAMRASGDIEAAVQAAKAQFAAEREELLRQHEANIKVARDKAIAQTLAVARERKKQG